MLPRNGCCILLHFVLSNLNDVVIVQNEVARRTQSTYMYTVLALKFVNYLDGETPTIIYISDDISILAYETARVIIGISLASNHRSVSVTYDTGI
jgi:hypothetical protein